MAKITGKTTAAKAAEWENLSPLLRAMYKEFQELSKKKPDGQVGIPKVKIVNRLLDTVHKLLEGEPSATYLDLLDEDDLPQNSDVVLILSQTFAAMGAFHEKYYGWTGVENHWFT
ncbi:hypothetical protein [Methylocella sp.]|jgi:hypothetical protein|uniref:hypothetical protein n=1 Tax=Methylocella sp. TaxID=1978226 RepID=UPI003C1C9F10